MLPNTAPETQRVKANTHRPVANRERGPHAAARLQGMPPRAGEKPQLALAAVRVSPITLSDREGTAGQLLAEITAAPSA